MRLDGFSILLIFYSISSTCEAYRILSIFPIHSASHFAIDSRLVEELAIRGHQVDVISHFPRKKLLPNYNDVVDLSGSLPDVINNITYDFAINLIAENTLPVIATVYGGDLCDLMDLPKFKELIQNPPNNPPYDLVIMEVRYMTYQEIFDKNFSDVPIVLDATEAKVFAANCYLAFGDHLKVPVVGVSPSAMLPWINDMVANPENPAYIPYVFLGLSGKLNFWQRFQNTLSLWIAKCQFSYYSEYQNDKIKKYIGPLAPSLKDAENAMSLILVNSHYSLHGVRPFTTAVVEVGGLHIKENEEPLLNDLQKWLDDSTNGFVLITFGSMLKIESFPKEMITALYSSLRKLAPVRVLMKVGKKNELPPGLPRNVLTLPWVPQSAVLHHKNIRVFMTHGGLMGTQEAVYHGVPMIGVPVFADQVQNIELLEQKKLAVGLNHKEMTEENIDKAFNAILHDPSYKKSAIKLSAEFRDRPMTASETAVFWVEYVIRHGRATLRSPALDLSWWQIALLDIYGAMILIVALAIYLIKVLFNKVKGVDPKSHAYKLSWARKNE